jgi:hypothetical protein
MKQGIPLQIKDSDCIYTLDKAEKSVFTYLTKTEHNIIAGVAITSEDVEKHFEIVNRPEPTVKITTQGKYECAPAAVSMAFNLPFYHTKRAFAKHGWLNDSSGCGMNVVILAAKEFGIDLFMLFREHIAENMGPCELTVPSLNYNGRSHGVAWNGKEILDPNYGYLGRKYYSSIWNPVTVGATKALIKMNTPLTDEEFLVRSKLMKKRTYKELRIWTREFIEKRGGVENL